ncbi:hypothetical protein Bbelb_125480 [Branchiostoma belcheri]|nr:hypothetical protein Bbelb_125480 [Branchiostoma belcheri]
MSLERSGLNKRVGDRNGELSGLFYALLDCVIESVSRSVLSDVQSYLRLGGPPWLCGRRTMRDDPVDNDMRTTRHRVVVTAAYGAIGREEHLRKQSAKRRGVLSSFRERSAVSRR